MSRVANQRPNGGEWTLSRALRDALPSLDALEAKKTREGKDFGQLVRERRRQRGLPLPVAEKVLPFRAPAGADMLKDRIPVLELDRAEDGNRASFLALAEEARVADAWAQLETAEREGRTPRHLCTLETAYHHATEALRANASPVGASLSPSLQYGKVLGPKSDRVE